MTDRLPRRGFLRMAAGSGAALTPFAALLLPNHSQGAQQASSLSGVPVLDGVLDYDDRTLRAAGTDSGGIVERRPRAVLKPRSIEDVVRIVRYANEHRLTIAMRGRGHSRYGQAQVDGGIVIDSRTLNMLGGVSNNTIEVQAGASLES